MNDREPRVFHYERASTKKQEASPETQKETALKYALFNNLGDVTHFVDAATTGKIPWDERDAGKALFRQLRAGDHVILAKLDRAFRKLSDCVTVLEKFESMGVKLHICNLMGGAIDLSSPMGRFMIHILAAFAELERAFISERTKDGIRNRKHRGFKYSRHPGYGFRWEKRILRGKVERVRVPDDDERNVMRAILRLRMQDQPLSWKEIADHLTRNLKLKTKDNGPWGISRVRRACEAELKLQLLEQRGNS
jgi:DNA invertase Pin-like site-specific DNA recombinase